MKISKKQWLKSSIVFFIMAGLFSLPGAVSADNNADASRGSDRSGGQTKTEFTTTMWHDMKNKPNETGPDSMEYVNAGVMPKDGEYHFTEDSRVTVTNQSGASFVDSGDNAATKIQADKSLTFDVTNSGSDTITGITATTKNVTTINAKKLNIHAKSTKGRIEGIEVGGQGGSDKVHPYKLTINGDIDMNIQGIGYTLGLYAAGNADIVFNGNVTAMGDKENNIWGLYSKYGEYGYYGCSLVYSGNSYSIQTGPKVTIEGDVNARIQGNGLFANGGHAKLTIKGGGYLEIDRNNKNNYYAMIAESGTTSMNVVLDENYLPLKANNRDFIIKGNISASTGAINENEPETGTYVNLGLATPKSEWTGVAYNKFPDAGISRGGKVFTGAINLFLQNGAKWKHETWGSAESFKNSHLATLVGGDTSEKAGIIYQTDEAAIDIDHYKGFNTIVYKHDVEKKDKSGKGWKIIGRSTTIRSAEPGSEITLITDDAKLNTASNESADKELVNGTLNALANKLFYDAYKNGEANLQGKVGIAENLTTPSVTKILKDMTFKKENGQGEYIPKEEPLPPAPTPQEQDVDTFTTPITGGTDQEYVDHHVKSEDGTNKLTYKFTRDTTIKDTKDSNKATVDIAKPNLDITLDASGHTLTMLSKGKGFIAGINTGIARKADISIKADKLIVKAENNGGNYLKAYGIYGAGQTTLQIMGATEISTVAAEESYGIYSGTESKLYFTGLKIDVNKNALRQAVIRMEGDAQTSVNVKDDQVGQSLVQLNGDVYTQKLTGAVKENSIVNLALTTKDSVWNGLSSYEDKVIPDDDDDDGDDTEDYRAYDSMRSARTSPNLQMAGTLNLWLQNGATWNNQKYGEKYEEGFKGSRVAKLTGGTSADTTGFIYQNDEKSITIDNYKGYTTIFYNHKTDKPADVNTGYTMIGGDTKVTKAEAGSVITLLTGNEGLETSSDKAEDKNLVSGTLNALANKLWYMAYMTDEENLTGKVGIAEGLTTSSVSKIITVGSKTYNVPAEENLKDITWKENGQGQYEYTPEKEKPPVPQEQDAAEFNTPITGAVDEEDNDLDQEYINHGVKKSDGTYQFTQDTKIHGTGDASTGISTQGYSGITINAPDKVLTIDKVATGVSTNKPQTTITAKKLVINAESGKLANAALVEVKGRDLTINGDVEGKVIGQSPFGAYGLTITGSGNLTVNGNVTALGNETENGITTTTKGKAAGIYTGMNCQVTVKGMLNVKTNGFGIAASANSVVKIGGGEITVPEKENAQKTTVMGIQNDGGSVSVNMNEDNTDATANKVVLKGNVGIVHSKSKVYMGLTTADSAWTGLSNINKKEESIFELHLKNGAIWNNQNHGNMINADGSALYAFTDSRVTKLTGGTSANATGFIYQNDENPITIDNYKGYTTIFYNHKTNEKDSLGKGWKMIGGDTKVTKAEAGSVITLLTGNEGLKTNSQEVADKNLVSGTLNALANKLWYMAHKTDANLTGKVGIAEGLTTRSVSKTITVGSKTYNIPAEENLKDITWKDGGQGEYKYTEGQEKPQQKDIPINSAEIFTADRVAKATLKDVVKGRVVYVAAAYNGTNEKDMIVDMKGKALTLQANGGEDTLAVAGIMAVGKNLKFIHGKENTPIHITAISGGPASAVGTQLGGEVDIDHDIVIDKVEGSTSAGLHTGGRYYKYHDANIKVKSLTIQNSVIAKGDTEQTRAVGILAEREKSKIEVTDKVDISLKGIGVKTTGGVVRIAGGKILTDNNKVMKHKALYAKNHVKSDAVISINMNAENDQAGEKMVELLGDIYTENREKDKTRAKVYLGLNTADSKWTGVVDYTDDNINKSGEVYIHLGKGATWNNEQTSMLKDKFKWKGSRVTKLTGGTSADTTGFIYQNDEKPITIDNYKGYTTIFYNHKTDKPDDVNKGYTMIGGDTKVMKAEAGSVITLLTGNEELKTNSQEVADKNLVSGTLNALANKLWYMAYTTGEKNLTGKVGIAEGLTTRSVSKTITVGSKTYNVPAEENLKDITWKENGQGQYEYTPEQEKPPTPQEQDVDTFTTPITGDIDQEYVDHHVKKENGLYQFTKDTILKALANNSSSMIQISSGKKVTVDASGKELHFDGSGKDNISFVNNGSTDEIQLTAKKLQLIANTDNAFFIAGFVNNKGTINGDVDMKVNGGNNSFVYGFKQIDDWTVNGNVTFNGEGKDVALFDSDNKGNLTFNKDVSIKVQGHGDGSNGNARGIHINEGIVHVKGNLNMAGSGDADSWGIDNSESALKKNIVSTVGLYAGGNSFNAGVESRIQVDGNTSITSAGSGVISEGLGAIVDLRGNVDIRVKKSDGITNYAVYSKGGKALINVKENGEELTPGEKDVVLVGDIALEGKNNLNSRMYMALINENSSWTGAIQSALKADLDKIGAAAHGQIYLQNGAQWNHIHQSAMGGDSIVQSFVGGDTNQTYGVIYQNDEKSIIMEDYKGYTTIFYDHKTDEKDSLGKGWKMIGGDTKVMKAEAGSVITLLTGNEGLKTDSQEAADKNLVSGTLNALANKLWYMAHKADTNLTGKVGIAEGLTSRSVSKTITVGDKKYNVPESNQLKDITWKDDGQGEYKYTPEQETPPEDFTTKTEFTESITGDKATDVIYEKAGILKETGKYELNRDIKIKTDGSAGIYHLSNSAISGTENMLSIENMYKNGNGMAYGVSLSDGGKIDINLKKLNVSVDSTSNDANLTIGIASGTLGNSAKGNISITGNVDVKVHGNNVAAGVYAVENHSVTINGHLSMVGDTADTWGVDNTKVVSGVLGHYQTNGIYAGFNGGKVHVNGDVNMAVKGTGMQANANSEITVTGGGNVRIAKDMNVDQYALEAEAGVVSFHYAKAGETLSEKDVTVEGNIGVLNKNSGLSPNEDNAATDIYLGLNTANSKWTGVAFNQFNEQGKDGGKIHLYLGNGATWNHEKVGMTHSDYKNSHIYELIGDDKGGVINQNDASDIIIDKMSGKYTVFMAHQNKGLTKDDYKVGNVYVKDADSGAEVTMITDTSGNIDMTKEEEVYQVLNTLAGKLFYQAGNTNLTGKVAIAEGLTTASAVKEVGDISFNKAKQGQGSVVRDSIKPKIPAPQPPTPPAPQPPTPPASEDKPAETLMMNGGKNAMALAATIWISNNNDLQRRMGDIRLSQSKNGLWARYLGGKNVWNPNQTNIDQQYNNIQIGYDAKVNGWTVGGAFDYGTSNDKYFIKDVHKLADASGDGKEKQYTFALYGSRQFEDGQYVDIIFKGAKVNSQYDLNYLGKQMKGDYNVNGVSISGEYGKRISDGNTYIEPSIEFTAGHLSAADYKASSTFKNRGIENANMTIHQDAFNTLRGRLGLAAGYQTEKSNAFVKLSLNKEFGGDIKATFRADGDIKNNPTTLSLKDTWLDVEVGGSYLMDKDTYLYANLTKSFSAVVKTEWRLDAGIRLAF